SYLLFRYISLLSSHTKKYLRPEKGFHKSCPRQINFPAPSCVFGGVLVSACCSRVAEQSRIPRVEEEQAHPVSLPPAALPSPSALHVRKCGSRRGYSSR